MAASNPLNLQLEANPGEWDIENKLFDILTTYLPPDSALSAEQAAEQINSLFPNNRAGDEEKESPGSFLAEFWDLMVRIAYQLDYQDVPMQRFIGLMKALKQVPSDIVLEDGFRVWQDLPNFSMFLIERWNRIDPSECKLGDEILRRWNNLNGLIAHLTNEEIYGGLYRALESLSISLERDAKSINLAPTASIWFVLCGQKIYDACLVEKCKNTGARGKLWRGNPGFNKERWGFWRSRFAELSTLPEAEGEIEAAIRAATSAMDAVAVEEETEK